MQGLLDVGFHECVDVYEAGVVGFARDEGVERALIEGVSTILFSMVKIKI